ncbi:1015_t:CDS:2 [Cetraspora pellucida]|uniref:1015_t:CDS:1 n=1 Tax=Cetraspora pellucida TaxID=1433469 RepID=A0A9N9HW12_9GLOM|nr:1015_t:CDS:2 [Cetraspora pellucida]
MPLINKIDSSNSTPLESCNDRDVTSPLESENNNDQSQKRNRQGGPVFDKVWDYVIRCEKVNPEHYKAECYHCRNVWQRGKPCILRSHLALHCLNVPEDIRSYWRNKLISNNNANKRDSQLPLQVSKNYDEILLRPWIMTNIPFEVIENPYIKNLFKSLNPTYVLPSHTTLSGRLLDEEFARIENNINDELENAELLDGWTSKRGESLYNYIIMTIERKEYLISLCNYSSESYTSNFIASEIVDIIERIGPQKFAAIITDSAANLKSAREKIQTKYPHIVNIRCIAHAINLIATDLSKIREIKMFIDQCGKVIKHFTKSPQKLALLRQGLSSMKIRFEGLETWCQTRWGSLYDTTNSILLA